MTATDMAAWADILRARYGIIWPISLITEPEELEEMLEDPLNPNNFIPFQLT